MSARPDWMIELFGPNEPTAEEVAKEKKQMAEALTQERARTAAVRERQQNSESLPVANKCPKCAGHGRLPQFQHRKGGTCFTCGGSGVFVLNRMN